MLHQGISANLVRRLLQSADTPLRSQRLAASLLVYLVTQLSKLQRRIRLRRRRLAAAGTACQRALILF